ncbi:retrovirus-related pol polyprotein from transposon TNT 1-94, partial [Tanacetum coccineum]
MGKVFTEVGLDWKPTGRLFTIVGNSCPLTKITPKKIVHLKETTSNSFETPKPEIKVYSRRPKQIKLVGSSKKAKIVESKIANNSEPNHLWGSNVTDVPSSYSLINDRLSRSLSGIWTPYVQNLRNVIILRVYYVEGLGHNLFSIGKFYDSDFEVAFWKNTCFIWNLEGVDLLSRSRDTNLYTISLDEMLKTSLICLLSKASKTKSWLWHRWLSHLNFSTLNKLAKDGLARETIHETFDELTAMASEQFGSRPGLQLVTPATSSSGLIPNPIPQQPFPVAVAPRAVDTTKSLVSTSIDLDAPSTSIPSTQEQEQEHSLIISQDKVMLIKLKLIYKVKTDEFGGVLNNKARLVAQGFRQEEGLKQAPRAWYDMLSSFLISQHFSKGAVDPTLFTRKAGNDLLLVQIYVDDIIFASTNTALCNEFANLMTTKFKMSMIGQMSFFLGLQNSQSPRGIFLNQSKYAYEIIKIYGLMTSDSVDTPMVEKNKLDEDLQGTPVDATLYCGMIRSLMYLRSIRPDLIYAVCLCAQRRSRGCHDTRRSTSGSAQFLGAGGEWNYGTLLCSDKISTGQHVHQTFSTRKIQLLDRKARYVPEVLNQDFIAPPSEEELVTFIQELGYSGRCNMLSAIHTDQMHQPWRTFGMYNKKNVDYVALLWEEFMYQADNREISSARKEHMPYPRFTKVIINHFISKDKTISIRNIINLHTIHDHSLLGTLKFVSKIQDYQQYGAMIPDDMINQGIKDSQVYKTYYDFTTGKVPPRKARKYKKVASPSRKLSPIKEAKPVNKTKRVKRPIKKSTTAPTSALSKAAQLKEATKRSKKDYHISQASGSGNETDFKSGVPNEQQCKTSSTDEGIGTKPGVPSVPTYDSESENKSWGDSEDDNDDDSDDDSKGDDDKADSDDDGNSDANDNERTDSDDDDENPSFTLKDCDEEEHNDKYESDDDNENVFEEEDDDLYKDVDVRSLGAEQEQERKGDEEMTNNDQNVSQESKFLILENVPPAIDEFASMMNVKILQEESSTQAPSLFTIPEMAIPETATPHTQPVSTLEIELSQLKQADVSAQVLEFVKSQLPTIVDDLLSTRIRYTTRIDLESYTKEFEKKAQEKRNLYIDVVEKLVKDIIKDEVKSLLPQILPKEVSDFASPVIQSTITPEGVNTGSIKVSTVSGQVSTDSIN